MTDKTGIYNLALTMLGDGIVTAADISGNSNKRAKVLNTNYATVRQATIGAYPWREARRNVRVAPDENVELLLNGDFASSAGWTLGDAAITITGDQAVWDGTQSGNAELSRTAERELINGRAYTVKAKQTASLGSGSMTFVIGGTDGLVQGSPSQTATVEYQLVDTIIMPTSTNQNIVFRGSADFTGTLDDVSCRLEIGDWATQYGIPAYDGDTVLRVWRFGNDRERDLDAPWEYGIKGTVIRSNLTGVQRMVYLRDITTESQMSPLLVTAVAAHLAGWSAKALTKSAADGERAWRRYREIVTDSRERNTVPGAPEPVADLDYWDQIRATGSASRAFPAGR